LLSKGYAAFTQSANFSATTAGVFRIRNAFRSVAVNIQRVILPVFFAAISAAVAEVPPQAVHWLPNIEYKEGGKLTGYERERCKLDVYLPKDAAPFPVLVWFHGGGLKNGSKDGGDTQKIARSLAGAGLGVVVPNYRLSPKVNFPAYIEDAAAAVAWARSHMKEHGGDGARLFVGGHSAGGYLTLMLGMDARYLHAAGVEPSAIAGFIPVSGQTMTHYTVREERGLGKFSVTADEAAPVYFARKDTPPFLVLYADHDMTARAEENAYFVALMKGAGHEHIEGLQVADRTHGSIASRITEPVDPAREAILRFVGESKH
jgi:acetyl esterase/lipase